MIFFKISTHSSHARDFQSQVIKELPKAFSGQATPELINSYARPSAGAMAKRRQQRCYESSCSITKI
jgi:hypothetical protein